ncbi:uncharacterized protein SEPMUDRAFT_128778 [Sphaerulina musiva SO2202]|uniref:Kazal-like domain-containing protein n=1 Tax=Sphaerulina musiva (strain SO2202) TaxID=692275 RepID=M3C9D3_SPHMS|nr:uncharacterized protein SEPMUDRAFT_128778 [Sphaerulina musiva SO2202]EMF08420.1 hypothetical protein SEPMUDRAFT_128778 [Sphaerulina musiva SO2202]
MKFLSTVFLCALTSGLVAAQCDLATNVCEYTNLYLCKRPSSGTKYGNCGQTAKNNCEYGYISRSLLMALFLLLHLPV